MSAQRRVLVTGAGPAGLATAAACAARGLAVDVVAPHFRCWTPTYGMWADELPALAAVLDTGAADAAPTAGSRSYRTTLVRTVTGGTVDLGRGYARLDNATVHAALLHRLHTAGARTVVGRARRIVPGPPGSVELEDGTVLTADVVVDARGGSRGTAQQRAWGERVTGPVADLVPSDTALLMDWEALRDPRDRQPPAFLYGFPLDDGTTLLEATSLAARPPVSLTQLRDRLHRLLTRHGLHHVGNAERVAIPLDAARSRGTGVAVGAAAGWIHPATGYSLAAALRLAPVVADILAGESDARRAARAAAALQSSRTHALFALGREVLLRFDERHTDEFFAGFFTLPPATWTAYLDPISPPGPVAAAMVRLGPALTPGARAALARAVVRTGLRRAVGAR
ncbi:lycopene cyclase family protein [Nakamurella deserti]|uniref:lycopene cyclase family protein n=1 Tax=Nakamurella deserti TaxID=2164074 RepID=UPI0013005213|nr:lycopene cyclase family protein [Nakamurella deserti]